jgi:hypothetical protein
MAQHEVSAPKVNRKVTVDRDFPVSAFTPEVVQSLFSQMATIKMASAGRAALMAVNEDGSPKYTDAEVVNICLDYAPQVGGERKAKDPFAPILAMLESGQLSKKDLIKMLEEKQAAKKAAETE